MKDSQRVFHVRNHLNKHNQSPEAGKSSFAGRFLSPLCRGVGVNHAVILCPLSRIITATITGGVSWRRSYVVHIVSLRFHSRLRRRSKSHKHRYYCWSFFKAAMLSQQSVCVSMQNILQKVMNGFRWYFGALGCGPGPNRLHQGGDQYIFNGIAKYIRWWLNTFLLYWESWGSSAFLSSPYYQRRIKTRNKENPYPRHHQLYTNVCACKVTFQKSHFCKHRLPRMLRFAIRNPNIFTERNPQNPTQWQIPQLQGILSSGPPDKSFWICFRHICIALDRGPGLRTEICGSEPTVCSNTAYRQITLALVY